jgi:hypothetical protein
VEQIDLVVLVPDKQLEATIGAILQRHVSLHIRRLTAEILVHPRRDPGCRGEAAGLLSIFVARARFSLVIFDRAGCGAEHLPRSTIESNVEAMLATAGWSDRAAAVVIDPELEAWVWSDSPIVDQTIGWAGASPALRTWLTEQGFLKGNETKPAKPKEAMDAALRRQRKRRSASIFKELGSKVSLSRCTDPAFVKLKAVVQQWFAT